MIRCAHGMPVEVHMGRNLAGFFGGLIATVVLLAYAAHSTDRQFDTTACYGGPIRNAAERDRAIAAGYTIDARYNCVNRASVAAANERRAAEQRAHEAELARQAAQRPTLSQARQQFATRVSLAADRAIPLPQPPPHYVQGLYKAGNQQMLPAFVTPDPNDGLRHPAVIWLGDGDTNSIGEFWGEVRREGAVAKATPDEFRSAGVVVMVPALRGGNLDRAVRELFYGEVDDVLAAANHLASLGYVQPDLIYVAGHGAGGTLALLTAEVSDRFAGVFAFGPAASAERYAASAAIDLKALDERELQLRSPVHWLHGIVSPTYIIEGANAAAHREDVRALCDENRNAKVHCLLIESADHFSVVDKVATVLAARVAISDGRAFAMRQDEF